MFVATCQIVLVNKMEHETTTLLVSENHIVLNNNTEETTQKNPVVNNNNTEQIVLAEHLVMSSSVHFQSDDNDAVGSVEEEEHNHVESEPILTPPEGFNSAVDADYPVEKLLENENTENEEKVVEILKLDETSMNNQEAGFEYMGKDENFNETSLLSNPLEHTETDQTMNMNDVSAVEREVDDVQSENFEEFGMNEKFTFETEADGNVEDVGRKDSFVCPDSLDILAEDGSEVEGEVIAESIIQQKDGTKKFWEDKMIAARQDETLSPPPGFDDTRAETPVSQTSSGSILLVEVPDDSYVSVGDLLPEEEPKKDYMYHDAVERDEKSMNSYEESESLIEIAKNTNNPTETFIEREIRMQKDREKQIQSEREVAIRNVSLPGRPTSATLPKLSRPVSKLNSDFPRPEKHKTAEALISQEMEDLKRREEELKWRQNMLGSHGSRENLLNDDQFASITTTDEGHYSDNDAASDERESRGETPQPNNLQKSHSMESLSSGHSSGEIPSYNPTSNITTDSKRRRVVVKPFDDSDEQTTVPAFKRDQKETPIEREIRLARDREEELRRDRGEKVLPVWASQPVKKEVRVPKEASQDQNRGVQLRMATSRIQAEIQEVSDKEKELRSAGKLQTTSEETVDSKVQRPSHLAEYSSELRQAREVKRSQLSRAVSTPQLNVEPENPRLPTLTRGFSTQVPPAKNPFVAKKASAPPAGGTQRGLMQKFINSRGKATSVSISSPEPPEVVLVKSNPVKASLVLNPVVVEKLSNKEIQEPNVSPTAVTQKPSAPRRHYLTAEEKIQEEMREMQRREEELRLQRVKSFSRSQPDLNGFDDGEPSLSNSENGVFESTENEANEDPDTVIRRPSHSVNAIQNAVKNQRRKSHLIAEWENRIMQN